MEEKSVDYGRFVVLGYSSYRVATAKQHGVDRSAPIDGNNGETHATTHANNDSKKKKHLLSSMGQLWEPIGDQNAQYVMQKRRSGNGVKLTRFHHLYDARLKHSVSDAAEKAANGDNGSSSELRSITKRILAALDADVQRNGDSSKSSYFLCVPMNDHDAHASVTEYTLDPNVDMFQIGRMPCAQNDVVIPGPRVGSSGTISRFAARIMVSREPPYDCRIFAGGFDSSRKMTTAGHALKHCRNCLGWLKRIPGDHDCVRRMMISENQAEHDARDQDDKSSPLMRVDHVKMEVEDTQLLPIDGLTKNGVRVWLPDHKKWFEVSVNGNLYEIEPRVPSTPAAPARRSRHPDTSVRHSTFNRPTAGCSGLPAVLTDGAVIDLGGVQLQFLSRWSAQNSSEESLLRASMSMLGERVFEGSMVSQLEKMNVQCPVQLHPLHFRRTAGEEIEFDQIPHVFPACGHVFGYDRRIAKGRLCPLCRTPGNFVQLLLKENNQLQSASERTAIPECVFNPCGHAISQKLATQYAALLMPNGRAICPFCAVHLDATVPYSRLYLFSEN
ncbi:hypothetical protein Poli38472_008799 [Pythium oligandrum]|uniref:Uncharacterized protein n=1 Tax=Pythium oligandrum TaxID=41045 RepID=A0A8K1C433_PYTOL|nr:hypothetical protein Poli38472_008799 [Pythium oligandrum]|eukprot:TMW56151.1 hypothetical protein Poli38472_008799 [Pythium oligandrum]